MDSKLKELLRRFLSDSGMNDLAELREELSKEENRDARETVAGLRKLTAGDSAMDSRRVWSGISRRCAAHDRYRRRTTRYAVAAVTLPLLTLGAAWYFGAFRPVPQQRIEPPMAHALIAAYGTEPIDIERIERDTVIRRDGYEIRLASDGAVSYELTSADIAPTINTIRISRGGERGLTLPDGTRVWLNSDSELRFPIPFGDGRRSAELTGEAYFDVAADAARPFSVTTRSMSVTALGTEFNVKEYAGEAAWATLAEGTVRVDCGAVTETLAPGQQLVFRDGRADVRAVDPQTYTAWLDGRFYFDGASLLEISQQMERWYDIAFVYADPELKLERFTGVFSRSDTANEVMERLGKIISLRYEIDGRTIKLYRK